MRQNINHYLLIISLFLDLSNNDIQEINRTELIKYDQLEHLDLSRNIIISFEGKQYIGNKIVSSCISKHFPILRSKEFQIDSS